ncbi:MAG: CRTAC1 family protein [Pirellulaceae bacterium]
MQEERSTDITLPQQRTVERAALPSLPLRDTTAPAGLDWVHVSGMAGEKLLPETMGGGVAVFDYDRDGDLDLLFVGGKSWDWAQTPIANPRSLCLYQNDGTAHFTDVTVQAGLNKTLYGMGPAVGDFDNDGWDDLYITAVGENLLFRNVEGKFQDVSQQSQTAGPADAWSTGASWLDYDNDGRLDLFVCDYVVWSRDLDLSLGFSLTGLGRAFGQPTSFTGTNSRLYHNEGEGRFLDVSEVMGVQVQNPNVQVPIGKGMGVAPVDVNHDGWIDVMVANDTVQNFLFINDEGKGFIESAIPCGVAFDRSGNATGAMGIDCSYFRNDDTLAIAVGNFANEPSSFFTSRGREMLFIDNALPTGLGPVSRLYLTFGMFFADLDLDSRQDIVCANGHLEAEISKVQSTQEYAQPPQFFWNAGAKGDTELIALSEAQVGPEATKPMVGRGAAYGDLDGDGDLDIVLVENSGPPRVLLNDQQLGHHWLRLKLVGAGKSNRNAYGALVTLVSGATRQRRFVNATRSYLSQCEATLTFGLGNQTGVDQIEIQWPDGQQQVISAPAIDQLHVITQNETGS